MSSFMCEAALPVLVPTRSGSEWDRLKRLVLVGVASENTRRAYGRALDDFLLWYQCAPRGGLSRAVILEYRTKLERDLLAPSTINLRLTAVRKLASEAAESGLLPADVAASVQGVRGSRKLGVRAGNWLTKEQAQQLLVTPSAETLKGKRDRAVLGLLVGCGLRRSELAALDLGSIEQRDNRWVIIDLVGKGNRLRTVPIPTWVKQRIDAWVAAAGVRMGSLVRPIDKKDRLAGERVTPKVIWWIVLGYAQQLGFANLAPHDLRRTCAKLCRAAGGELEQIQLLLGHASVQTTEQYLGTRQNLMDAVNDHLDLDLGL